MEPRDAPHRPRAGARRSRWRGLLAGTAGGLAGALAMSLATALIEKARRPRRSFRRYLREQLREGGQSSRETRGPGAPTDRSARRLGLTRFRPLRTPTRAGTAVHLAFGIVTGALYGVAAEYAPRLTAGAGVPFGLAVWLGPDETVLPLLGLSKPPRRIPAGVHATALAAHAVFGLTTEAVRRSARGALGPGAPRGAVTPTRTDGSRRG